MTFTPAIPPLDFFDPPGAVSYPAGSFPFTIPNFKNSITFEMWGGGANGTALTSSGSRKTGNGGKTTSIAALGLYAYGGSPSSTSSTGGGNGGGASGGDENVTGGKGGNGSDSGSGTAGKGGDAPGGGVGGNSFTGARGSGYDGSGPGGGGSGACNGSTSTGGGGSGGRCKKTFLRGQLTPGDILTLIVAASSGIRNDNYDGGEGAPGQIDVNWS